MWLRAVLKRLSIDATSWHRVRQLTLTEDEIVRAERATRAATEEPQDNLSGVELNCEEDGDAVRVIPIARR